MFEELWDDIQWYWWVCFQSDVQDRIKVLTGGKPAIGWTNPQIDP